MPTDAGIPPNISEITAPLLLGMLWNWALYGVLVVQVYVYSYNFPGDGRVIKLLVYGVFLLETLQTTLSGADLYYWFVSGFGNMERLANPYASPYDTPMIGGIISMTVQFFFSYRIWVLGGRKAAWRLCAAICLLSIMGGAGAFFAGIQGAVRGKFPTGRLLKLENMIWLLGNTLSDLLIATSMVYYLTRQAVNGNLLSDRAITKILRLTIETNTLTTIVGVTALSMVAIFPVRLSRICFAHRMI
ncbi:hypothetical protein BC834DRAFT_694792 [Gloeopeniophorella convolvens]|nr:hypothetical protein BC834DRAFT_694792 [Gloeopeniophorella convolvens]